VDATGNSQVNVNASDIIKGDPSMGSLVYFYKFNSSGPLTYDLTSNALSNTSYIQGDGDSLTLLINSSDATDVRWISSGGTNDNPVTAAEATANYQSSPHIAPQVVVDSTANVAANLDGLETLAAANDLASITLTDAGTPARTITATQIANDGNALAEIVTPFTITVADTAVNVTANLTSLEQLASRGELASVNVTDGSVFSISLPALAVLSSPTNSSGFGPTGSTTPHDNVGSMRISWPNDESASGHSQNNFTDTDLKFVGSDSPQTAVAIPWTGSSHFTPLKALLQSGLRVPELTSPM
jgi:hypothetical protein